jgi:phosphopantothenoylcysteine decarboxylase/phosphopantothenate--cysteine ligase
MARVLITAGPTHEPIDPVRFIGNRSSGRMGAALAAAAMAAGHSVTVIYGPATAPLPPGIVRIDVETAQQMHDAVLDRFPAHDLLIMAAAVADFRPRTASDHKLERRGTLVIELEATQDILAAAGRIKRPDQRTVGFSLVDEQDLDRSRRKLESKNLDLIVHNPPATLGSQAISGTLLYRDGRSENLGCRDKAAFADILIQRATALLR